MHSLKPRHKYNEDITDLKIINWNIDKLVPQARIDSILIASN